MKRFPLFGQVINKEDNNSWPFTGVYGPQDDQENTEFLGELRVLQLIMQPRWLLCGDFNLKNHVQDVG